MKETCNTCGHSKDDHLDELNECLNQEEQCDCEEFE